MKHTVIGMRAEDPLYKDMRLIYDTCTRVGVAPPRSVMEYFDFKPPTSDDGLSLDLTWHKAIQEIDGDLVINLPALPSSVHSLKIKRDS